MYRIDLHSGDEPDWHGVPAEGLFPAKGSDGAAASYPSGDLVLGAPTEHPKPSKGTFCNETIVLRDAAGASLVSAVTQLFDAHRRPGRKSQLREIENERQLLSCMLANALRCSWCRRKPLVAYQRKADATEYRKPGKPEWFSAAALGRAAQNLAKAHLAELQVGNRGAAIASGYSVTGKLLALASELGVSERSLGTSLQREDLVRLKAVRPKATFDVFERHPVRHKADRIYFEPTSETEEWRDGLTAYNDLVARHEIAVEAPDDVICRWVEKLNTDDSHTGAQLGRPELFRTSIYRVFNDGNPSNPTFDKGGRFAGAWWLNAPGEARAFITINGEPTLELDYDACHPRMLYHELGLEPHGKLYGIPEVAALELRNGFPPDAYRDFVKWLTQVLINGGSRPDLVPIPKDILQPLGMELRDVALAIERRHEPISSAFRSRAGLRLMRTEADIAYAIITKAMTNGWLALPVHDAFLVPASKVHELRYMMMQEYKIRLGRKPIITRSKYATKHYVLDQ